MEDPRPQLDAALKDAMRNKDVPRRNVLRMVQSAIKQVEIDTRKELSAADVVDILQKEAKKRRESIADLQVAGRENQVKAEETELEIIKGFLPKQLSEPEITTVVKEVIAELGVTSPKQIGEVMGPVMQRLRGQADGKLVNQIVRQQLNS